MYFKINEALERFYASFGVERPTEDSSRALLQAVVATGHIHNVERYGGLQLIESTNPDDYPVNEFARVLRDFFHADATLEQAVALFGLTVWGEGDCPECGGRMECVETVGHGTGDGDYYTPEGFEVEYYVYRCPVCGETIKIKA